MMDDSFLDKIIKLALATCIICMAFILVIVAISAFTDPCNLFEKIK